MDHRARESASPLRPATVWRSGASYLAIGLFLGSMAFWNVAGFFHEETGPDCDRDCPVCRLDRASGCETPQASLGTIAQIPILVGVAFVSASVERHTGGFVGPAAPRGPPNPT